MSDIVVIFFGFIFGILLVYSNLNKFNKIAGNALFKNMLMFKTIMLVIGVGSIIVAYEMASGNSTFHLQPLYSINTWLGGLLIVTGFDVETFL